MAFNFGVCLFLFVCLFACCSSAFVVLKVLSAVNTIFYHILRFCLKYCLHKFKRKSEIEKKKKQRKKYSEEQKNNKKARNQGFKTDFKAKVAVPVLYHQSVHSVIMFECAQRISIAKQNSIEGRRSD